MKNIPKVPAIPESLIEAAAFKNLVPFIGAGASKFIGYPGWDEFANEALRFFVTEGILNHAQFDQLHSRRLSPRVKLSMAKDLEMKHSLNIDYRKILSQKGINQNNDNIYEYVLALLQYSRTFVTTNYDEELDGRLPQAWLRTNEDIGTIDDSLQSTTPIYRRNDINVGSLDIENAVIHIHGSVRDPESMVLTTSDYLDRYYGHEIEGHTSVENPFLSFLQQLFKSRNVLFIGYGLDEFEILEYVIQKGIKPVEWQNKIDKHYILQGFYSHNIELANSLESYFQSLGITLLPFSLDENGWDGLTGVIKHLINKLPPGERLALEDRRFMEDLLPKKNDTGTNI